MPVENTDHIFSLQGENLLNTCKHFVILTNAAVKSAFYPLLLCQNCPNYSCNLRLSMTNVALKIFL